MMEAKQIAELLKRQIPGAEVDVRDLTGTMDHFEALVISDSFEGMSMVEQHQAVYRALQEEMKEAIHALKLKTYTRQQWQARKI